MGGERGCNVPGKLLLCMRGQDESRGLGAVLGGWCGSNGGGGESSVSREGGGPVQEKTKGKSRGWCAISEKWLRQPNAAVQWVGEHPGWPLSARQSRSATAHGASAATLLLPLAARWVDRMLRSSEMMSPKVGRSAGSCAQQRRTSAT